MRVAVIGLGYIGLPTALIMAANGNNVIGVDLNDDIVETLKSGKTTFSEEGLDELFLKALENGIEFTSDYPSADLYVISVPTPYDQASKKVDPKYVISASQMAIERAPKGAILVVESTISPGVIDKYIRPAIEEKGLCIGEDIHLVHAPERIIPGNMLYELEHNSRTVGADDPNIAMKVKELYSTFCKSEIVLTDIRTAELSKVVENTFRDINIAFANELALICREVEVDIYEVIKVANHHPRVNILSPGPGVGGHCIPVDPWFLVGDYPDEAKLILKAREVNSSMPQYVFTRIKEIMQENNIVAFSKVGLYGLTYKEDVDDTRESPTIQLLEVMNNNGITDTVIYDPYIKTKVVKNQVFNLKEFIDQVELIVILVAHREIIENTDILSGKLIFDTKNAIHGLDRYKL